MSLSKYQLERADLTVTIEQGRRVEADLFAENHRTIQTMGELLKARMFGATEYALSLRKRMTNYVQGGGVSSEIDERAGSSASRGPHRSPGGSGYERPPEHHVQGGHGYTDPLRSALAEKALPEPSIQGGKGHGVRGEPGTTLHQQRHETPRPPEPHPDLDIEELWRPSHLDLVVEPLIGRLKVPSRYRRDESDK